MTVEAKDLGLYYVDEPDVMREVAAFVLDDGKWLYHSRGSAQEAVEALKGPKIGFIGGVGSMDPKTVKVVLDCPSWEGGRDRRNLLWDGPSLTVEEFLDWYWGTK